MKWGWKEVFTQNGWLGLAFMHLFNKPLARGAASAEMEEELVVHMESPRAWSQLCAWGEAVLVIYKDMNMLWARLNRYGSPPWGRSL